MTGKELQQSVKLSGKKAQDVADGLGLSRQSLYDLFKKTGDIGEEYTKLALQMGLTVVSFPPQQSAMTFTADQLHKMWLDEMKDRRAEREDNRKLSDALIDLAKSQAEYMKSLADFVAEQTKILSSQAAKQQKATKATA